MPELVFVHWAPGGLWIVTRDAMELVERVPRVILKDVRFVIDPVGIELSRKSGKRKTHAWAVGERIRWDSDVDERDPLVFGELVWHLLTYRPRRGDDHFGVLEDGELTALAGADYMDADLEADHCVARIAGPQWGATERRYVQQYGGVR